MRTWGVLEHQTPAAHPCCASSYQDYRLKAPSPHLQPCHPWPQSVSNSLAELNTHVLFGLSEHNQACKTRGLFFPLGWGLKFQRQGGHEACSHACPPNTLKLLAKFIPRSSLENFCCGRKQSKKHRPCQKPNFCQ